MWNRLATTSELERVGGTDTLRVDVRVVAASTKDLLGEIERGSFREDLYYRLAVVPILLPDLKDRREDIPELSHHFLAWVCKQNGYRPMEISEEAIGLLMLQRWPGNVRELRNLIERLAILSTGQEITSEDVRAVLPVPPPRAGREPDAQGLSLKDQLACAERQAIAEALESNEGNVAASARALGLERSHLYKKMRQYGLAPGAGKGE